VTLLFLSRLPTLVMHAMQAAQAFVTDLSVPETRAASLGRLSLSYGIGMIVGAPLGGFLSRSLGYSAVATVGGLILACMAPINWACLTNTRVASSNEGKDSKGLSMSRVFGLLREGRNVREMMIFQLLLGLAFAVYHSMFSVTAAERFGMRAEDLGLLHSFSGILSVLINTFVVGWVTQRFSQFVVLTSCALTLSASMLASTQATTGTHVLALVVPMSLASAIMYTVMTAALTKMVADADTGTVIGLTHASRSLCGILSPTLGGYLYTTYGAASVGYFGGAVAALALAYWGLISSSAPGAKKAL